MAQGRPNRAVDSVGGRLEQHHDQYHVDILEVLSIQADCATVSGALLLQIVRLSIRGANFTV